jgi:predicted DNA-binding transcriptional regulator YafY
MSAGEAEALFVASAPGAAAELGLGPALAAAQLKLRGALPPELSAQAERMRAKFHLDVPGWYTSADDARYLREVADAVWNSRVLDIRYRRRKEPTDIDRRVEPYGLVLKAGCWYLVAGPGPRTYRIDQILELAVREEIVQPPDDFDLAAYWTNSKADFSASRHEGEAVVRIAPEAASSLTGAAARALADTGNAEPNGWIRAVLPMESITKAHRAFLAMGADVEVLEPPALRARLAATSHALAARYGSTDWNGEGDAVQGVGPSLEPGPPSRRVTRKVVR